MSSFRSFAMSAALFAAALMPVAAQAGDKARARDAIAQARGKLAAVGALDANGPAIDARRRGETVLAEAQSHFDRGKEDRAYFSAREADALAELALAHAELRRLTSR